MNDEHQLKNLHISFNGFVILRQIVGDIGVLDQIPGHSGQGADER